jgi:hypothetical protein
MSMSMVVFCFPFMVFMAVPHLQAVATKETRRLEEVLQMTEEKAKEVPMQGVDIYFLRGEGQAPKNAKKMDRPIYLSIYLFIYLSVYLSIYRSIDLSIYLSLFSYICIYT